MSTKREAGQVENTHSHSGIDHEDLLSVVSLFPVPVHAPSSNVHAIDLDLEVFREDAQLDRAAPGVG